MPLAQVILAPSAALSRSATACPLRFNSAMSALITRPSICSVTPGSVAIRAPASEAALREAVCESDCTVGARTTSAAFIAAAIVAGGSAACDARSAINARTASAPARPASPRSRSPSPSVAGFATTSTCSPSRTRMQSLTTADTARSMSSIARSSRNRVAGAEPRHAKPGGPAGRAGYLPASRPNAEEPCEELPCLDFVLTSVILFSLIL